MAARRPGAARTYPRVTVVRSARPMGRMRLVAQSIPHSANVPVETVPASAVPRWCGSPHDSRQVHCVLDSR